MTVIKRDRSSSAKDLTEALLHFAILLEAQGEADAVSDLRKAAGEIRNGSIDSPQTKTALTLIVDAFEGDHELSSYIIKNPDPSSWTEAEELSQAATRVLNLVKRLRT